MNAAARLTAGARVGIAAVHVAWGRGSSFPFTTTDELTDAVAGVPGPDRRLRRVVVAGGSAMSRRA